MELSQNARRSPSGTSATGLQFSLVVYEKDGENVWCTQAMSPGEGEAMVNELAALDVNARAFTIRIDGGSLGANVPNVRIEPSLPRKASG